MRLLDYLLTDNKGQIYVSLKPSASERWGATAKGHFMD